MIVAKWRSGFESLFRGVDAQMVAEEIASIGESPTAHEIVDAARDEGSELHKCFEWDDSIAAERYREKQARDVVHHLVIEEKVVPTDRPEIRIFHKVEQGRGYQDVRRIVQDEDSYQNLLARAWAELRAFKAKYGMISELKEILDLIQ